MLKEQAISLLTQVKKIILGSESWLDSVHQPIEEAFGMAIEAIKSTQPNTPNTLNALDTIYRQAAIDELMKRDKALRNINWYDKPFAEGECKGIDDALEIINALPSAQTELIERTAYIRGFEQGRTQGMIDSQAEEIAQPDLQPTCNQLATDCVSKQAVIKAVDKHTFDTDEGLCLDEDITCILEEIPSAQLEITLESAIGYLHEIGWMQEHDRILTESAQPELIRCRNCKYAHLTYDGDCKGCDKWLDEEGFRLDLYLDGDFYCGYAERKEE